MPASGFLQNKNLPLSECAALSLGYSYRGRIEATAEGAMILIQMRDLTDANLVNTCNALRTNDPGFTSSHYLKPGDLVFRARGMNNSAAIAENTPEQAALASPLIRIRANADILIPRYLQWFINLPASQAFIGSGLQGSLVRMVSIEHLARLVIVVPALETQRKIVELATLYAREADLLRRISGLRESLGRSTLERLLGIDRRIYGD
jgi:hypothetical protein